MSYDGLYVRYKFGFWKKILKYVKSKINELKLKKWDFIERLDEIDEFIRLSQRLIDSFF